MTGYSIPVSMTLIDNVTAPLRNIMAAMGKATTAADRLSNSLKNVENSTGGASSVVDKLPDKVSNTKTKLLSLAAASGFVVAGLTACVSTATAFEKSMSNVGAVSGASAPQLAELRQSALDLGAATSFSAMQVADAQTELAKKGFRTNEIVGSMPGLLNLAAASGAKLSKAADVTAVALNAFNLDATESSNVADIIAAASNTSATNIHGLGRALQNAGAITNEVGGDFAMLAAMTSKLADSGVNAAAGATHTKIMMTRLATQPKATKDALESLGIATKDASGNMLPLLDTMENIQNALAGMGSQDRTAHLKNIFGSEAVGSVMALMNQGIGSVKEYADVLRNSTGSAAATAEKQLDNLSGALTLLGSALESLRINIGSMTLPVLTPIVQGLAKIVTLLNAFASTQVGKYVIGIAGSLLVAFIALTTFSGGLIAVKAGFTMMVTTMLPLIASTWAFTAALLACPLTWVVIAVAAVAGALYYLYNRFTIVKQVIQILIYYLGFLVGSYIKFQKAILTGAINIAKAIFNFVKPAFMWIPEFIENYILPYVTNLFSLISKGFEAFKSILPESLQAKLGIVAEEQPQAQTRSMSSVKAMAGVAAVTMATPAMPAIATQTPAAAAQPPAIMSSAVPMPQVATPPPISDLPKQSIEARLSTEPAKTRSLGPLNESEDKKVSITISNLNLTSVKDADSFADELMKLVSESYV